MKLIIRLSVSLIIMLIIACGGGSDGSGDINPNAECDTHWKNKYVYDELRDRYLWYDQVPTNFDHKAFESPRDLLEAAIPDIDRWSTIVPAELYQQYSEEGRFKGVGLALTFDIHHNLWVRFVYEGSPADKAGIRRSDRILSINDCLVSSMEDLRAVWEETNRYATASIEIRSSNGDIRTEIIQSDWVTINTVLHREVINIGRTRVGYLVFQTFIERAETELDAAFAYFRQQGIDDLILDLRYNGGGRTSVAQHLANLIAGDIANGEVFQKITHNDRYRNHDRTILFDMPANALGLSRLFVISTDNTCSASEVLINGLKPYIQVIQVGSTTCGKPVGMYPTEFCDLVFLPIHIKYVNANDKTDYFEGLVPTCPAMDDLTRPFGAYEENSLRTALLYIANSTCPDRPRDARRMQAEIPPHVNELWGIWKEIGAF